MAPKKTLKSSVEIVRDSFCTGEKGAHIYGFTIRFHRSDGLYFNISLVSKTISANPEKEIDASTRFQAIRMDFSFVSQPPEFGMLNLLQIAWKEINNHRRLNPVVVRGFNDWVRQDLGFVWV